MGAKFKFLFQQGRGPDLTTRFKEKRSTFSIFFLFPNGYIGDRRGCRGPRGYCRAPGRASAAALGGGKGFRTLRNHSPVWQGCEGPATQPPVTLFRGPVISSPGVLPLTFHPLRGRKQGLGGGMRTRCVQNVPLLPVACPTLFPLRFLPFCNNPERVKASLGSPRFCHRLE